MIRTETAAGHVMRAAPARSYFGDTVFLAFLLAQILDGVFTYLGIVTFGTTIEANPLVAWAVGAGGAAAALIGAKTLAVVCAITLHAFGRHRTLGLLTVLYLGAAIFPWTRLLWP